MKRGIRCSDKYRLSTFDFHPSDKREEEAMRMQHLMSLRGRASKAVDPEIVRLVNVEG